MVDGTFLGSLRRDPRRTGRVSGRGDPVAGGILAPVEHAAGLGVHAAHADLGSDADLLRAARLVAVRGVGRPTREPFRGLDAGRCDQARARNGASRAARTRDPTAAARTRAAHRTACARRAAAAAETSDAERAWPGGVTGAAPPRFARGVRTGAHAVAELGRARRIAVRAARQTGGAVAQRAGLEGTRRACHRRHRAGGAGRRWNLVAGVVAARIERAAGHLCVDAADAGLRFHAQLVGPAGLVAELLIRRRAGPALGDRRKARRLAERAAAASRASRGAAPAGNAAPPRRPTPPHRSSHARSGRARRPRTGAVTGQLSNAADADRDPDHEKTAPRRHTTNDRTAPAARPARHDLTVARLRVRGSAIADSGTLGGFPNPPAMVRGEQSSPAPHALIQQPRPAGHGHAVSFAQLHVRVPDALGSGQTQ